MTNTLNALDNLAAALTAEHGGLAYEVNFSEMVATIHAALTASTTLDIQLQIQVDGLLSENVDLRQRLYILERRINAIRKALNEG